MPIVTKTNLRLGVKIGEDNLDSGAILQKLILSMRIGMWTCMGANKSHACRTFHAHKLISTNLVQVVYELDICMLAVARPVGSAKSLLQFSNRSGRQ